MEKRMDPVYQAAVAEAKAAVIEEIRFYVDAAPGWAPPRRLGTAIDTLIRVVLAEGSGRVDAVAVVQKGVVVTMGGVIRE